MQKGRPKSITQRKNRKHTLYLNEEAEFYLRELRRQRPSFDLTRYINECILDDFKFNHVGYLKHQLGVVNTEIQSLQSKANDIVNNIENIRAIKVQQ